MTESETTTSVFDGDPRQFQQILSRVPRSRENLLTLVRCANQLKLQAIKQGGCVVGAFSWTVAEETEFWVDEVRFE